VPKKKLIHFRENFSFQHLFQPSYKDLVAGFPLKGRWNSDFFGTDQPIVLEIGCGKGEYTVGLAGKYPGKNFIGIDWKGARLWRGCKTVADQEIQNVGFLRIMAGLIDMAFTAGEVAEIWITFPDPQYKKERLRLTSPAFLSKFKEILIPGGIIHLKTDDRFFYTYTLEVIEKEKHTLLFATDDLYHSGLHEADAVEIQTYYENRWLEMGKKIHFIKFQPGIS
jgi:tRNA (guanine-N7-)-methyltransferase